MSAELERRIAAALANGTIPSGELRALISGTEQAITEADASAAQARVKALDPQQSPDPHAARQAMEDAEFVCDRLQTLLPRLQKYQALRMTHEARDRWRAQAEDLQRQRDALAQEFAEVYPRAVAEIADLMARTTEMEREIQRCNAAAPSGESHLEGVELTARGLSHPLMHPRVWICENVRLPNFRPQAGEPIDAWPPPKSPFVGGMSYGDAMRLAEQAARMPSPFIGDARNNIYPGR